MQEGDAPLADRVRLPCSSLVALPRFARGKFGLLSKLSQSEANQSESHSRRALYAIRERQIWFADRIRDEQTLAKRG